MRRWWDEKTRPEDVTKIKMLGESKEKERCGQYRELMAAFDRAEAFGDASFNPALIELEHMLDTSTVNPKPTSLQQAERLYCQSLTNLKKYEYFRFVQTLMKQQSPQKEMIFGDTFNECLTVLAELGAIHPSVARATSTHRESNPYEPNTASSCMKCQTPSCQNHPIRCRIHLVLLP